MKTFMSRSRGVRGCAFALVWAGLCWPVAKAQSTTQGAIAGTVEDATGAVIGGANVVLHNNGTNAEIKLTTDASGYFKAPLVNPGIYTVTITASGFGDYTANTVAVTVGSLSELHPTMNTGTASESVTVSSEAPLLKMESAEISETLTSKEIVNLPLNGGRWSNLALLTPGAVSDANGYGLISFRGISPLLNTVEIDGADDNQAFFSEERGRTREGYSTSQIAIAEFQVNTGVFSAEFGRAAGGVLNAITKSGTNSIHGQTYFYDRDNDWGALNPFTTYTSVTYSGDTPNVITGVPFQPKDWRKRWGFGAGGPLIKDKLFWFYAYDQYRRNFPGVAKPSSPNAFFSQSADMALPSDDSCISTGTAAKVVVTGTNTTPTDVKSGDAGVCALAWRVYSGNYATAALHYTQLLYGTAASGATGLTGAGLLDDLGTTPRTGDEVLNTPKLDWQISGTEHLSALYHRLRWDSPGGVQTQTSNNYATDTFGTDFVKLDYGLVELASVFSPSLSNELRFQYGRELDDEGQQAHSSFTNQYLNNTTGTPVQLAIYGGSSNNGFTAGMPYYSFRTAYPDERKTQLGDTANWTYHNQNLKFGFDILRNADTVNNLYESNGVYTYTYFSDFFADILQPSGTCDSSESQTGLGAYPCYYGFTQGFGTPKFTITTMDYGFFAQDDWKLTPRLTMNIGVRYDYEHVPPPFPSLIATEKYPYAPTQNQPSDKNNIGPRIGFSWDPYGKGKMVVHAGYGLYYGRILNGVILNAYEATGSPLGQYTVPSIYGEKTSSTVPQFPQVISSGTFPTPSLDYFAKNFQAPQTQQYDLSVQQDFGHGNIFTLSYLGSMGRELPNFLNLNLNPSSVASASNTAQSTMYQTTLTVTGTNNNCGPLACGTTITSNVYAKTAKPKSGSTVNTYVNADYGSVTEVVSNINSSYNALVAEFTNRSNKYAQFDLNYTWSHALDYNQNESTSPSTNNWYDPWNNPKANYGNSAFNVPNRFVAWALLNYPGNATDWKKYLINSWHLNPVVQVQNGLPYSAATSGTMPSETYGNYTYSAAGSGMTGSASSSYLLQIGRDTFKQPTTADFDMRLEKDLPISERFNVELLGEVFNVFNHVNVTGVNTTAYSISGSNLVYNPYSTTGGVSGESGFGAVTNANSNFVYSQRQIQLGMKLDF
ncbi:TonB-dependent receptor [Silvibacterium dinghuense]|uniref:TonB-dependent receptor n=1 Tax=Silvibacterium dinghuense TaxID=1560006 RepID=A0A4Q1SJ08_9BACT|nr:TonB-dependent receptor [Silvibacterium dinghuense]RXS97403.1 TonB-dependent receptor [Silvibacterium dinghuense]GGG98707.1 Oar protein [Silvibacterium dinghuense]